MNDLQITKKCMCYTCACKCTAAIAKTLQACRQTDWKVIYPNAHAPTLHATLSYIMHQNQIRQAGASSSHKHTEPAWDHPKQARLGRGAPTADDMARHCTKSCLNPLDSTVRIRHRTFMHIQTLGPHTTSDSDLCSKIATQLNSATH